MFRQRETNPHFLPRSSNPVIEFPSQSLPPPRRHNRTPPQVHQPHSPIRHTDNTQQPLPQQRPLPPHDVEAPSQPHHDTSHHGHGHEHGQTNHRADRPSLVQGPKSQKTRPIAWLVAAFCALFWIIIIIGGLIILIVYLVFRPRNPKFDISTATLNAAYLDMGYLLNADFTLLANFTNPNTKVNVDFSYVILDLYYDKNFIATRYVEPFSVMKGESRFEDVHLMASQVRLSMGHSLELKKQMNSGRVNFEIKGLFKTRSKLGGFFQYSYWLYAHCQIEVTGPPTGILIGKKCVTKR